MTEAKVWLGRAGAAWAGEARSGEAAMAWSDKARLAR
jgi:hypothetical protein